MVKLNNMLNKCKKDVKNKKKKKNPGKTQKNTCNPMYHNVLLTCMATYLYSTHVILWFL